MTTSTVERAARLFRFGDYPDKNFSCTAEEFIAANGASGEVPIGFDPISKDHYQGKANDLDGRLGSVLFSVVGNQLLGVVRQAPWLDELQRDKGYKFSGIFGRQSKVLSKVDYVERSRVRDAIVAHEAQGEVVVFSDSIPDDDSAIEFAAGANESLPTTTQANEGTAAMADANQEGRAEMSDNERRLDERAKAAEQKIARLTEKAIDRETVAFSAELTRGTTAKATPGEAKRAARLFKVLATLDHERDSLVAFSDAEGAGESSLVGLLEDVYKQRPFAEYKAEKVPGGVGLSEEPAGAQVNADAEFDADLAAFIGNANPKKRS